MACRILNDRQKKAVDYLKNKGRITNKEYREINSVSNRIAFEELLDLVSKKIIIQKGKGGLYHMFLGKRLMYCNNMLMLVVYSIKGKYYAFK